MKARLLDIPDYRITSQPTVVEVIYKKKKKKGILFQKINLPINQIYMCTTIRVKTRELVVIFVRR